MSGCRNGMRLNHDSRGKLTGLPVAFNSATGSFLSAHFYGLRPNELIAVGANFEPRLDSWAPSSTPSPVYGAKRPGVDLQSSTYPLASQ